ncbi:MAG: hypothetical protein P9M05_11205, partial [Candidatus Stygibacter australis]|nr:hypothetical protein [Candidatus Stygibacter australis]
MRYSFVTRKILIGCLCYANKVLMVGWLIENNPDNAKLSNNVNGILNWYSFGTRNWYRFSVNFALHSI